MPMPNPDSPEALNRDQLRESCGGDPDFEREVLEEFARGAPELLMEIAVAQAGGDGTALANASHTLRGSCHAIGADPLAVVCQELERLGHSGDLARARDALVRAEHELRRLQAELEGYLGDLAA